MILTASKEQCWIKSNAGLKMLPSFPFQSEIGFGKLETYIKLDKLGEVRAYRPAEAQEGP